ncbi:MAG: response regulator [Parcubacteria group bacterium]|nr:MAG: response regulator [Parcubacteria group bacterium]
MLGGKAKILFIDDDNFLRKVYKAELSENGYEVLLAAHGEEGLVLAKGEKPDLIILDMIMPQKNGFEVLAELKKDSNTKNIPVIILSNLGQEKDIERGLSMGAVEYLVKDNMSLEAVITKLKRQLNQE